MILKRILLSVVLFVGTDMTIRAEVSDAELEPSNLEKLLLKLEAEGFVSVKGAEYASGWFSSSVEGSWEEDAKVLPFESWPGRIGNTWLRADAENTNLVWMVTGEGIAWRVDYFDSQWRRDKSAASFIRRGNARLGRDIAKLTFALEEGEKVNDEAALVFAMQLVSAGHGDEARRIVELLRRRPAEARQALAKLRTNLSKARAEYPTVEARNEAINRKAAATNRKKRNGGVR